MTFHRTDLSIRFLLFLTCFIVLCTAVRPGHSHGEELPELTPRERESLIAKLENAGFELGGNVRLKSRWVTVHPEGADGEVNPLSAVVCWFDKDSPSPLSDSLVSQLERVPQLREFRSYGEATDADCHLIARLQHLEMLVMLRENSISDEGMRSLGKLSQLRYLQLNGLSNRVSVDGYGELKKLTKLFYLGFCPQEAMPADRLAVVRDIPSLRHLTLFSDVDRGHIDEIARHRTLVSLQLFETDDDELEPLEGLAQLQRLDFWNARISERGVQTLTKLSNLHSLHLLSTELSAEGFGALGELSDLEEVSLTGKREQQIDLSGFTGHEKITRMSLNYFMIDTEDMEVIASLPELTELSFFVTWIEGDSLLKLKDCTKLEKVSITYGTVSPSSLSELRKALPKCEIVLNNY